MESGAVYRVGWLLKRGAGWNPKAQQLGRWLRGRNEKRRYFVLVCHMLYYFVDSACKQDEEKGCIDLRRIERLLIEEDKCVFELVTLNRVFVLRAETESDADGWLRAICDVTAAGGRILPIESALGVLYGDSPRGGAEIDARGGSGGAPSLARQVSVTVRSRRGWLSKMSTRTKYDDDDDDRPEEQLDADSPRPTESTSTNVIAVAAAAMDAAEAVASAPAAGNLRRRFFVLRPGNFELLYFRKERGAGQSLSNPLGRIDLRTVRQIHPFWNGGRPSDAHARSLSAALIPPAPPDRFEIEAEGKTFHLLAASGADAASWMADLRAIVDIATQGYDGDSDGDRDGGRRPSSGSASALAHAAAAAHKRRATAVESLQLDSMLGNAPQTQLNAQPVLEGWLFKRARRKGASSMDPESSVTPGGGTHATPGNSALRLAQAQVKSGQLPAKWKTAGVHELSSFQFKKRYFTLRPPMLQYGKTKSSASAGSGVTSALQSLSRSRSAVKQIDLATVCGILQPHDAPECFQLLTDERTLTLSASGPAEASVWVESLRQHIGVKEMPRRVSQMKGWCAYEVSMADLVSMSSLAEVEEGGVGSSDDDDDSGAEVVDGKAADFLDEWRTTQLSMEGSALDAEEEVLSGGASESGVASNGDAPAPAPAPAAAAAAAGAAAAEVETSAAVPAVSDVPAASAVAPAAAESEERGSGVHQGVLFKRGTKGLGKGKEKSRYFVLARQSGVLRYFKVKPKEKVMLQIIALPPDGAAKSSTCAGELGSINLDTATSCVAKAGATFELLTPTRTYVLRAESSRLAIEWENECSRCIATVAAE